MHTLKVFVEWLCGIAALLVVIRAVARVFKAEFIDKDSTYDAFDHD
ncbi:MAG: hypothetical protein ACREGR_03800 [Minisyncoccia bacterium]